MLLIVISVQVKYFASLRERLGREQERVQVEQGLSAVELWRRTVGIALPENALVAVNMEYASPETIVQDGDEVAFFPPITGG